MINYQFSYDIFEGDLLTYFYEKMLSGDIFGGNLLNEFKAGFSSDLLTEVVTTFPKVSYGLLFMQNFRRLITDRGLSNISRG